MRDRVKLQTREIREPLFGGTDFSEDFGGTPEVFAKVRSTAGRSIFAGNNVDVAVSHEISIRFCCDVNAETWVELEDGTLLDILAIENPEERNEYLILQCTERGPKTQEASKA